MHTDIMIDLETLSTDTNAMVLSIGAVRFDPTGDDINDPDSQKLYLRLDIDSASDLNLSISDDTIDWWSKQSKEAQDEAFASDNRVDYRDAFEQLYKFCWGARRVWSNGASFDVVVCETIFKRLHKAVPWKYYQVRDVRTMFDLGMDPYMPDALKHHALEDAWRQAVGIQNITRSLKKKGVFPFQR